MKKTFRSSLRYFYSLALVLSFVFAAVAAITLVPAVNGFLNNAASSILKHFPDDLEIAFQGGRASINKPEPYFIPLTDEIIKSIPGLEKGKYENLLVINTKDEFTIDMFQNYHTIALLTKNALITINNRNQAQIQFLNEVPDTKINKKSISVFIDKVEPLFKYAGPLLTVGLFIAIFIASNVRLLYLFFPALLVWLYARIKKYPLTYKKAYQVSIHAMTFSAFFSLIELLVFHTYVPYLFTTLLLAVVVINFPKQLPTPEYEVVPAAPPATV